MQFGIVRMCHIVVENDANSNLVEIVLCFLAWNNLLILFKKIIAYRGTHIVTTPSKKMKLNFSGNQNLF